MTVRKPVTSAMRMAFVLENGADGVACVLCEVADEHDLDEDAGFRAAVTEGCAALGWNRTEWDFRFPHEDGGQVVMLILCRPRGDTPTAPAFQ